MNYIYSVKMRRFGRIIAALLVIIMSMAVFTGCGKKEEIVEEDSYKGMLSKIRLGMDQDKVISITGHKEVFYESDSVIWIVDTDTNVMGMIKLVPEENQFYYVDDSIITFQFGYNESAGKNLLKSYEEQVTCLLPRDVAEDYYQRKVNMYGQKYQVNAVTTLTGTEDVDNEIIYESVLMMNSFSVVISMTLTYNTVDEVPGYYCSSFSIRTNELSNKVAVTISGGEEEEEKK